MPRLPLEKLSGAPQQQAAPYAEAAAAAAAVSAAAAAATAARPVGAQHWLAEEDAQTLILSDYWEMTL